MSFQNELNRDTPGRTWVSHGAKMGVGRCVMGPLRDVPNPRYPQVTTYAQPTQQAIDEARADGEEPMMDIINAMYEYDADLSVWKCRLGGTCGRFPRTRSSYSFDQMSCQTPNLPC
jgi:hypothetical protein